jgi:hypothetical protein
MRSTFRLPDLMGALLDLVFVCHRRLLCRVRPMVARIGAKAIRIGGWTYQGGVTREAKSSSLEELARQILMRLPGVAVTGPK